MVRVPGTVRQEAGGHGRRCRRARARIGAVTDLKDAVIIEVVGKVQPGSRIHRGGIARIVTLAVLVLPSLTGDVALRVPEGFRLLTVSWKGRLVLSPETPVVAETVTS